MKSIHHYSLLSIIIYFFHYFSFVSLIIARSRGHVVEVTLEEDGEEREHVEVHVEAEEGGAAAEVDGVLGCIDADFCK